MCISKQSWLNDWLIVNELEVSSCMCIPTDNSDAICTSQDLTLQNSSYCSSLAQISVVFRGVTTISIRSNSSSALSKTANTSKGKVSASKSPIASASRLGVTNVSNNQLEIKALQTLSQSQDEILLRKSVMQNGSYAPIGVTERRFIRSRPFLQ